MKENNKNTINLLDLFWYLLSNWYWFLICIAICTGLVYYKYAKTEKVYRSDATVIIKDPSNTRSSVRLDSYSGMINRVNMSNEILELQSKQLMTEVVRTLDADVNYTVKDGLRSVELYDKAPVQLMIARGDTQGAPFMATLTPLDEGHFRLNVSGLGTKEVCFSDTLNIYENTVTFLQTESYPQYLHKDIKINKIPERSAAAGFLSRLRITQTEDGGTILKLSLQDFSLSRANDILNTLVIKYNEDAIREKNRIAINTAAFIDERIEIIKGELGEVEEELAAFKSSHRLMSANETASRYLNESRGYNAEIVKVETKIKLAEYLKEYVLNNKDSFSTIPINTGLGESYIETAITQYNSLAVQRERLIEASSSESPAVKKTESSLLTMGQNILSQIETLLSSLEVRKKDLTSLENDAVGKFAAMPLTARRMLAI